MKSGSLKNSFSGRRSGEHVLRFSTLFWLLPWIELFLLPFLNLNFFLRASLALVLFLHFFYMWVSLVGKNGQSRIFLCHHTHTTTTLMIVLRRAKRAREMHAARSRIPSHSHGTQPNISKRTKAWRSERMCNVYTGGKKC